MRRAALALWLALAVTASGCSTVYYAAIAQLGWAKHDLLAERVQLARDSQEQARRCFTDALPLFDATAAVPPPPLAKLQASYDACAEAAAEARVHLAGVAPAADAFFTEWKSEIAASSGPARARAQQQYDSFRLHGDRLLEALRDADAATAPVLDAMRRQLAALRTGAAAAPPASAADADHLLRALQAAVALADQYVAELETLD